MCSVSTINNTETSTDYITIFHQSMSITSDSTRQLANVYSNSNCNQVTTQTAIQQRKKYWPDTD